VLGVVYAPALGEMYFAKKGEGAFKARVWGSGFGVPDLEHAERLPLDTTPRTLNSPLVIVASKSHLNLETKAFIENLTKNLEPGTRNPELVSKGSSLKLVMVAEGTADIYPRLAPTMEWDTAAADAIVREAGKMTYQYNPEPGSEGELRSKRSSPGGPNPEPLLYNKQDLLNPWFVVK
jgi:3'(2'), 5'-bisphosphate nucleotidase